MGNKCFDTLSNLPSSRVLNTCENLVVHINNTTQSYVWITVLAIKKNRRKQIMRLWRKVLSKIKGSCFIQDTQ